MENDIINRHHIWCNFVNGPVETCRQCKGLKEKYPEEDLDPDELLKKYFPDARIRK